MNERERDHNRLLRAEGLTALWLDSPPPAPGKRPELGELAAWTEGKVGEPRSSEIRAHVARDPECFRNWAALRQVQQELDGLAGGGAKAGGVSVARLVSTLGLWLRPRMAGGLATAVLTVLVLTLGLHLTHAPGLVDQVGEDYAALRWDVPPDSGVWPRPVGLVSKGLGGLWTDPVQGQPKNGLEPVMAESFRLGVRQGLERLTRGHSGWERVIDTLPRTVQACTQSMAGAECLQRQRLLEAAGQWTVLEYLSCSKGAIDSERMETGRERARAFARQLATPTGSSPFAAGFEQWAQRGDEVASYCARARLVLMMGLDS